MNNRYCPLCEVWIKAIPTPNPYHAPSTPRLEWYQKIRAVRLRSGTASPVVTGVGYLCSQVHVPDDPNETYNSGNVILNEYLPYFDPEIPWAYPFHDACWKLLALQTGSSEDSLQLAKELFSMLLSSSVDSRGNHSLLQNTGVAKELMRRFGDPTAGSQNTPWSFIYADPTVPVEWTDMPGDNIHSMDPSIRIDKISPNIDTRGDIFARLPSEIIYQILVQLPTSNIPSVRLASEHVAVLSDIDQLPQNFWHSRFSTDYEMGFISLIGLETFPDWRYRYFQIKKALARDDEYSSLKNRRRIWLANSQSAQIIRLLRRTQGLQGEELSTVSSSKASDGREITQGRMVTADIIGDLNMKLPRPHRRGCRELEAKDVLLSNSVTFKDVYLGISTVRFTGKSYISGFRIFNKSRGIESCVGLIAPERETILDFKDGDVINSVELSVVPTGIVSLRFAIGGRFNRKSDWIGEKSHKDSSVTKLVADEGKFICGFSLGLDVCKVVRFGILQLPSSDLPSLSSGRVDNAEQTRFVDSNLWIPDIPCNLTAPMQMTTVHQSNRSYEPLFNIDFGGAWGQKLCSLCQITAFMNKRASQCFMGLEFKYCDGSNKLYGRRIGARVTMLIDGPGGERISDVVVESSEENDWGIQSLVIGTNFQNTFEFRHRNQIRSRCSSPRKFQADSDCTIVGFIAMEGSRTGSFQSFGILACHVKEVLPLPAHNTETETNLDFNDGESQVKIADIDFGVQLIAIEDGIIDTFAYLQEVRCIRFSRDTGSSSIPSSTISGLFIDYYNSRKSRILGQWIEESSTLNLERTERITGITFWLDCRLVSGEGRAKLGRVVRIDMLTSNSRSITVGEPTSTNLVRLNYRESRFEELRIILWSYTASYDHPRILTTLPSMVQSPMFQPETNVRWIVNEIIPWKNKDQNGNNTNLKSIAVHCASEIVVGLTVKYESGASVQLGCSESEFTSTKHFAENETLVCLEIEWDDRDRIQDIIFLTENEIIGTDQDHRYVKTVPSRWETRTPKPNFKARDEYHVTKTKRTKENERYNYVYFCPPGAKFAGFWGRSSWNRMREFGVFYVKEEPE